jgi:hypothetical protein
MKTTDVDFGEGVNLCHLAMMRALCKSGVATPSAFTDAIAFIRSANKGDLGPIADSLLRSMERYADALAGEPQQPDAKPEPRWQPRLVDKEEPDET